MGTAFEGRLAAAEVEFSCLTSNMQSSWRSRRAQGLLGPDPTKETSWAKCSSDNVENILGQWGIGKLIHTNTHLSNCLKWLFWFSFSKNWKAQHSTSLSSQREEKALAKSSTWIFRMKWLSVIFVIGSTAKQWKRNEKHCTSEVTQLINRQQFTPCSTLSSASHLNGIIFLYNFFFFARLYLISFFIWSPTPLLEVVQRICSKRRINLYLSLCD